MRQDVVRLEPALEELGHPRQPTDGRVLQGVGQRLWLGGLIGVVGEAAAGRELFEELQRGHVLFGHVGELGGISRGEGEELGDVHSDHPVLGAAADLG
jgi:hypothetical protein